MYDFCFLPTLKRYKCEKGALQFLDERVYMIMLDGTDHVDVMHIEWFFFSSLLRYSNINDDLSIHVDNFTNVEENNKHHDEIITK